MMFQFLNGSINIEKVLCNTVGLTEFQFLNGSINIWLDWQESNDGQSFQFLNGSINIVVRLLLREP